MLLFAFSTETLQVSHVSRISNPAVGGLAAADDGFWSTDPKAGRIYRHDADADLTVRGNFLNPGQSPSAIFWDGQFLWVHDQRSKTVHQFSVGKTLSLVRQHALPGLSPAGLHVADGILWILDGGTLAVHRYRIGPLLTPMDSALLTDWTTGRPNATGFAVDKEHVWILTDNPPALRRFALSGLAWKLLPL